ncbi:hypothetical protein [Burkholderia vietnamiensis]|uniref:hypothetical protein n=1 Tax=Burkholderia vietnamiensis TaxID=60552 RepID=UPI001CF1250E|nr:hypothetical protein [Burkholderia vietnamiensis]MCA8183851.1 hypothetical protein [Burkholderia vietnamiensis]
MKNSNEIEAKNIVRRGLDNWVGTLSDFHDLTSSMFAAAKGISSPEKRDDFIGKYIKKSGSSIYVKKVKFGLSNQFAIEVQGDSGDARNDKISKADKKRASQNHQKLAQYRYKLSNKTTYVFVVKDGTKKVTNELIFLIYSTRGENKGELFSSHSIGVVKKHCLERLVQRLNLDNINKAIDEILPAAMWLEGSGKELAGRSPGSYGENGIKRHIPTQNGALLLLTEGVEVPGSKPVQECSLITWIHKRQFKKDQRVTNQEFTYAMSVNYFLSDPELPKITSRLKGEIAAAHFENDSIKIFVHLHGEQYSAKDFLESLENNRFLDFIIDFERDTRN